MILVLPELLLEFVVLLLKIESLVLLNEIRGRETAWSFLAQVGWNASLGNLLLLEFLLLLLGFLSGLLLVSDSLLLSALGFLLLLLTISFGLASFPHLLVLELLTGSFSSLLCSGSLVSSMLLRSSLSALLGSGRSLLSCSSRSLSGFLEFGLVLLPFLLGSLLGLGSFLSESLSIDCFADLLLLLDGPKPDSSGTFSLLTDAPLHAEDTVVRQRFFAHGFLPSLNGQSPLRLFLQSLNCLDRE